MPYGPNNAKGPGTRRPEPSGAGNPMARYGSLPAGGNGARASNPAPPTPNGRGVGQPRPQTRAERWADSSTAQQTRGRVGHLRGAIQTNKDKLAEQRRLAATGTPDERRKARLAQGPIIDRIKSQAAQREKEIARAKKMGWTDDDLKPRSGRGTPPAAPGVGNPPPSNSSNPPSVKGSKAPKSTRGVTPRKRDFTVDQKNVKANTVLGKALKMYGDPRTGPDKTGEMLQDGAKSPHHVKLTGKEFQNFKKKYLATHERSGGKNLSDWSLRAMAKMLKYKNSETLRKTYGLSEYKPPEG